MRTARVSTTADLVAVLRPTEKSVGQFVPEQGWS
jgi:hypothetical protein